MKIKVRMAFLAIVASMTASNTSHQRSEKEAQEILETNRKLEAAQVELDKLTEAYRIEVETFRTQNRLEIEENNRTIAELKAKSIGQKKELKDEYFTNIEDLEYKNNQLLLKLENHKEEGRDNWEKFKLEFNNDLKDLDNSFEYLTIRNTESVKN